METKMISFQRKKTFLLCIDSDGCAMDAMTIKHKKCFGPAIIKNWHLEHLESEVLHIWNYVNLKSEYRGINRFAGLIKVFSLMRQLGYEVPNLVKVEKWVEEGKELSAPALEKLYMKDPDPSYYEVLVWSSRVNEEIEKIEGKYGPFPKVKEVLQEMSKHADIVVVSSANEEAIVKEWTDQGFGEYVNLILGQEAGSKKSCIERLLDKGDYPKENCLMIGDAFGDEKAAKENEILFYPILADLEEASWKKFLEESSILFLEKRYQKEAQVMEKARFHNHLAPIVIQ